MALREKTEYAATVAVLTLTRILPEAAVYALFKGFALLFYAASARRRNLSLRNMEIAFPEKPEKERRSLVKKSYINLSESMAFNTLVLSGRIGNERMLDCIETEGWEAMEQKLSKSEKGFLFFSGHLGNWELSVQHAALRLRNVHVVSRKTNNQLLEERVVRPLRERFGVTIFYKKNALMRIVKAIKRGGAVGLMIDQKLNPPEGIPIDFFGKPAPTTPTPALLQIRFQTSVFPIFMIKIGHRKYRSIVGEPVEWTDNGKPMQEQVIELSRIHQGLVEEMIRKYPDQWFWMHNRWALPKEKR